MNLKYTLTTHSLTFTHTRTAHTSFISYARCLLRSHTRTHQFAPNASTPQVMVPLMLLLLLLLLVVVCSGISFSVCLSLAIHSLERAREMQTNHFCDSQRLTSHTLLSTHAVAHGSFAKTKIHNDED